MLAQKLPFRRGARCRRDCALQNGWQGLFQEEAGPKRDRYRFSLQRSWEPDRNANREPNMKAGRLAVAAVAFAVVQVCTNLPAHAQSVLGEPVSGSPRKY